MAAVPASGIVGWTIPRLPSVEKEFSRIRSVDVEPNYLNYTVEEGYGFMYAHME